MRAREFITEHKISREEFEGMTIEMVKNGHVLVINALDDWGNNILGHVAFNIGDDNDLDPQELEVDERYQGQGIAKAMYDYAKSKGYTIHRSYDQTNAGAGFWNKHRGEDVRVWEDLSRRGFLGGMLGAATGLSATDAEAAKKKQVKPVHHDKDAKAMNTKIDPKYQLSHGEELAVLSNNPRVEIAVQKAAKAHGITHPAELAQFMAQTNHESWDFTKLYQVGDKRIYGGKGLIQLTGKNNYAAASQYAGVDLVRHPEQAAKLDTALKIAIWFWKNEVRRYAKTPQQFMDTRLITRIVNGPDMNGLQDRHEKFKRYLSIL